MLAAIHQYYAQLLFQLLQLPAVGRTTTSRIIAECHRQQCPPQDFWRHWARICSKIHISKKALESIKNCNIEQLLYQSKDSLEKEGIRVLFWWDAQFPPLLSQREDHPLLLFVKGSMDCIASQHTVAVVGSRRMTSYGSFVTKKLVQELVSAEQVIVSGGMYGVDLCAHQSALAAGGNTIVVLGYGFNHIYPVHLQKSYAQLLEKGACFVTEYFPQQPPQKSQFVVRNGVVAGMSQAVLVTEAAIRSGTHTTCQFALENGSDVFAVAGSITSPFSQGTQWLVNQGATLVSSGFELLDELRGRPMSWESKNTATGADAAQTPEEKVLSELQSLAQTTQQLSDVLGLDTPQLMGILTKLELTDAVTQEAGVWHLV